MSTRTNNSLSVKESYPELGDNTQDGTLFPITLDTPHSQYEEKIRTVAPERLDVHNETRRRILRLTETERLRDLVGRSDDEELIALTGKNLVDEYLAKRAGPQPVETEKAEKKVRLSESIRKSIASLLRSAANLFDREGAEKSAQALKEAEEKLEQERRTGVEDKLVVAANDADDLIKYVVDHFFPGHNVDDLGRVNEVKNSSDLARLLMVAFDNRDEDGGGWSDQSRFEAKRKIVLTELMYKINEFLAEQSRNSNNLSFFDEFMDKHMYSYGGQKKGDYKRKYLIPEADKEGKNHEVRRFIDEDEKNRLQKEDSSQRVTPIALRSFKAGVNGNRREIDFHVDSRSKTKISLALKMIRKDTKDTNELLKDLNGVRFVFENEHDIDLFEYEMERCLRGAGYEFDFKRGKEAIGPNDSIKCRKYNVEIGKNGSTSHFEFQTFTCGGFDDYFYGENAWAKYEIDRFFESSSSQALVPGSIYPKIKEARQQIAREAGEKAMDRFRQDAAHNHVRSSSREMTTPLN